LPAQGGNKVTAPVFCQAKQQETGQMAAKFLFKRQGSGVLEMHLEPGINMEQTQKLVMTPELRQAIAILQLGTTELAQYVDNEVLENPLLEVADDPGPGEDALGPGEDADQDGSRIDWITYLAESDSRDDSWNEQSPMEERTGASWESCVVEVPNLGEHLTLQLHLVLSDRRQLLIGEYLIGNIDERGYLTIDLEEACKACGCTLEEAEAVLRLIQTFDPPGVGGRSLSECLLIQLEQRGLRDTAMEQLVCRHLDELAAGKFARIAAALGLTEEDVRGRAETIRDLEPKPGRNFSFQGETRYIVPDLVVEKVDDEYVVLVNDAMVPRLMINKTYRDLLQRRETCDPDTVRFIEEKLKAALWLIRGIEQRRSTLYRVMCLITRFQRDFLDKGPAHLKGLTLRQVAQAAGLNESTVSRATANKYVQTPRGVFNMKYFFCRGLENDLTGELVASDVVKRILKELVAVEDARRPYSDQELCRMIASRGIHIARRTVAKYRQELGVLPARARKRAPAANS
jgi:RNA polymerase sigma-54 factor